MDKKDTTGENKYITISLPRKLKEDIEEILKLDEFKGQYTGHSEFCKETIRRRVQEIRALKRANDSYVDDIQLKTKK